MIKYKLGKYDRTYKELPQKVFVYPRIIRENLGINTYDDIIFFDVEMSMS